MAGGIPGHLQDGIAALLGPREIVLAKPVQLQLRSKQEDDLLVLTPWRAYLLPAMPPVRVRSSFSFLEVREIGIQEPSQVAVETDTASYVFRLVSLDDLEQVVIHVTMSLKKVFPDSSPRKLLRTCPPGLLERLRRRTDALEDVLRRSQGPCGGFSETYAALCDYNGFPFREEIQWDVDNIYHSQDCREFNLLDFTHLESRDVALSIAALSFNLWFTRLYSKDFRLNPEISEQLLYMLGKSASLEELVLENGGLKWEFAQRMAQVLSGHPDSALSAISLAGNPLEDRGMAALSQHLERRARGLRSLTLSRTSLTAKGASALCQALAANGAFSTSLQRLDLSGNPGALAADDAGSLLSFLSRANAVSHLSLAGTDCAVDALFDALALGCCAHLAHLDLARNLYSHRKAREVPPSVRLFFSRAAALRYVGLACTKLPPEAVRALLQGLACNSQIRDLQLDLSSCELGSAGAQVIQDLISDASAISTLDLADNGFDADMVTLVLAIGRSKSIRHVSLGKNFNIKSKDSLGDALHRIVQLTQDDDCPLQSLSLAESRLKVGTNVLLNALGSNASLSTLDLSGNAMGDAGAAMLAKALQINTALRNYTLRSMPLPLSDVGQAYRGHPEKTEAAVHKMQACLARNQMRRTLPKQTFRLQQGIVTSSSEQMVSEMCASVQRHAEVLSACLGQEADAGVRRAEEAVREANLSVSLLPLLYEAGHAPYQSGQLQHKLESLAEAASQACARESQAITQAVLDSAQSLCPAVLQRSGVRDRLLRAIAQRIGLQDQLGLSAILDQLVADVFGKLTEIRLSVVAAVADGLIDEVLEGLAGAQRQLAESLPRPTLDLPVLHSDNAEGADPLPDAAEPSVAAEEHKLALRRKSRHLLGVRPTPAMTGPWEPDLQAAAEETGTHQALLPGSGAALQSRPASTKDAEAASRWPPFPEPAPAQPLMELPTEGGRLEHCTRARPRPNRRHRQPPSKPHAQPAPPENDEDRSISRVDEGLEEFFSRKLVQEALPSAPRGGSPGPAPSAARAFKKKIGTFFAFKKPRSGRGCRGEKEPGGSPVAAKGRKSLRGDGPQPHRSAGEPDEGGLLVGPGASGGPGRSPEAAPRPRPKYSREGKSQSLILLPGEDAEALGAKHETGDGAAPSSLEQRVHVMLQRIGVARGPPAEGQKQQNTDGEIKKAGSDGDIVDSSASPPLAWKPRTHSMSTEAAARSGRAGAEPSRGPGDGRLSWKALGKQLNMELKGKRAGGHSSPPRAFSAAEPGGPPEQPAPEAWSSSLPWPGRSTPAPRRPSGEALLTELGPGPKPKPRLKAGGGRRAVSVHEEQLREQGCPAALESVTLPLRLQRSPVLKRKPKPNGTAGSSPSAPAAPPDTWPQDEPRATAPAAEPQLQPAGEGDGEQPPSLEQQAENTQNSQTPKTGAPPGPTT
ncbi:capping protein, Arp2/3 and myosin-I linker protein 2 isoform X2 [Pelodiscus sinensis]|uniref:capping protein, Arp2/3 and myosin-I linker protein 2 isoform X2 n=1 Tax=Pelodiscus sinensis TaxID=13735 RepID=UPI003F6D7D18